MEHTETLMEWKFWRGWQVDFWKLKRVRGECGAAANMFREFWGGILGRMSTKGSDLSIEDVLYRLVGEEVREWVSDSNGAILMARQNLFACARGRCLNRFWVFPIRDLECTVRDEGNGDVASRSIIGFCRIGCSECDIIMCHIHRKTLSALTTQRVLRGFFC